MIIAKKVVENTVLTFQWADGTETMIDLSMFPKEIIERAALHGLSQKLGDSYSGAEGDVQRAFVMFKETLDALHSGDWNRKGGGISSGGIWVEALVRATGSDMETVLAKWNEMDEAEKAAIKKHDAVRLAKAQIELERAKAKAKDAPALTL